MNLYQHQQDLLDRNPHIELLCWDTGTGKTRGSLEWVNLNRFSTVVIVCPKALRENWKRECDKWLYDDLEIEVTILTKEEFKKQHTTLPKCDAIIVDEAHYFLGMRSLRQKSAMAKSMLFYLKKHEPARLFLTATPYLSTPWNIYFLARLLGRNWNYREYKDRYFQDRPMGMRVISEPRPGIEDNMARLVKALGSTIKIQEAADVPDQVFEREDFELTKEQLAAKKDIFEVNPIVRFTKYHQIENGTLKGDGYTDDKFLKCDKTERLRELVEMHKKIAIVCRYNLQIEHYKRALKIKGRKLYVIQGDTKNRDEVVQQAEAADECVVLINASCSEGYELPSVPVCVFASLSFSFKDYKQMLGRFLRMNKLKKNVYIHLVSRGMDEDVYNAIMLKQDFNLAIYAEQKHLS